MHNFFTVFFCQKCFFTMYQTIIFFLNYPLKIFIIKSHFSIILKGCLTCKKSFENVFVIDFYARYTEKGLCNIIDIEVYNFLNDVSEFRIVLEFVFQLFFIISNNRCEHTTLTFRLPPWVSA